MVWSISNWHNGFDNYLAALQPQAGQTGRVPGPGGTASANKTSARNCERVRAFLRFLVRLLYGFRAVNEESLQTPGPVLLLPNHTSWWDWLLIGVCLEKDWRFVTSLESSELSWFHKKIMVNRRTFPVDMHSPYA